MVASTQVDQSIYAQDPRGAITLLHIPCKSFASLFVVRFLLGLAEACIVPSFLLIMSMFLTYQEQAVVMPIMWSVGNASPITSGLLSYGTLHIHTVHFASWQWLMRKHWLSIQSHSSRTASLTKF